MKTGNFRTLKSIAICAALVTAGILATYHASVAADDTASKENEMISVMVTFHVAPGEEAFVEKQMAWFASECIKEEPGTLLYTLIKDDKGLRTMEIYENEAAFRAHGASPHHAENVKALTGKVTSIDLDRFEVINHPTR